MPTTAERQALAFLAGVALLGGGARAWTYYNQAEQSDLHANVQSNGAANSGETVDGQLAAIESARSGHRGRDVKTRNSTPRKAAPPNHERASAKRATDGRLHSPDRAAGEALSGRDIVVDADVATVSELQMLPRISPALAERIVANRDSFGGFGALSVLGRVRGLSSAIRYGIRDLVVFSGPVRVVPPVTRTPHARQRKDEHGM